MDISNFVASVRDVEIINPENAEPIGLTIRLRPATSPEVTSVKRVHTNTALKNRGKITAEKIEANGLDILVAATAGWTWGGALTFGGTKPEPTAELIRRVYKEMPWVRQQIDDALGDEASFFRRDERVTG